LGIGVDDETNVSLDYIESDNAFTGKISKVGDRTPNVKKDADGGLTIYIGGTSPGADKERNWLPGPASGPFTLTFRTYIPGKDIVDQKWFPPGLVQVK
jgi:hypothetical protein